MQLRIGLVAQNQKIRSIVEPRLQHCRDAGLLHSGARVNSDGERSARVLLLVHVVVAAWVQACCCTDAWY